MRCLNCSKDDLGIKTEICPRCGVHIPSLMRDLLPMGHQLRDGTYRLDYPLGKGGFGVTYRAYNLSLDKPVAIKEFYPIEQVLRETNTTRLTIPQDKEELFEKGLKRFLQEAQTLAKIEHPNIVKVQDYFKENNTAYLVMSLIQGKTLSSRIDSEQNRCLDKERIKEIGSVLVDLLETIHQESIYHLDIKPENILIGENEQIYLVDFGASKQGLGSKSTQAFTISYAPPEVIAQQGGGAYSDIFSLGVTIYKMLTGNLPPDAMSRFIRDDLDVEILSAPWDKLIKEALTLDANSRPSQVKKWWNAAFREVEASLIYNRYKILKKIGEGGFGKTYLAEDCDRRNDLCILKELKASAEDGKKFTIFKKLFEREAEQLLRLGKLSLQIPNLEAYFEVEGKFYLVLEYIKGNELTAELRPGRKLSEGETIELLKGILEPVGILHQEAIIHRDIKPSNLMRRERDGKIVLIDFGAVKELTTVIIDETGQPKRGSIIGTPGYMPIEQAMGRPKTASDIYAVGIIAIQALTGLTPQQLKESETGELIWPKNGINDCLSEIITKMVKHKYQQRYSSGIEVLKALKKIERIQGTQQYLEVAKSKLESNQITPARASFEGGISLNRELKSQIETLLADREDKNPTNSDSRLARRRMLRFAGLGTVGLTLAILSDYLFLKFGSQQQNSQEKDPPSQTLATKTFSEEVVNVNKKGQIIKRYRTNAKFFSEDLGNGISLEMVEIPSGSFLMGAPETEEGSQYHERPQHNVTISSFLMGRYPVTQAQWKAIASRTDLKQERDLEPDPSSFKGDDLPVEEVNWYEAVEFCQRLSKLTGREYRLPSEAEWEYSCRAGTTTPFHFGETITTDLANYDGNLTYGSGPKGEYRQKTTPVGYFNVANGFGLYDMHGNIWEWCQDDWHDNYENAPTDGSAWLSLRKDRSPLRGGSWDFVPTLCRSAFRYYNLRVYRDIIIAFRVVCGFGRSR